QQQLLAVGGQQAEAEAAVLLAETDETRALGGLLLAFRSSLHRLFAEAAQPDRLAQLAEERGGDAAGLGGAGQQDVLEIGRARDQRIVTFAGLRSEEHT